MTVFFAVIIGSFSLGNALPELETFATALGAATVVFEVIDRVSLAGGHEAMHLASCISRSS